MMGDGNSYMPGRGQGKGRNSHPATAQGRRFTVSTLLESPGVDTACQVHGWARSSPSPPRTATPPAASQRPAAAGRWQWPLAPLPENRGAVPRAVRCPGNRRDRASTPDGTSSSKRSPPPSSLASKCARARLPAGQAPRGRPAGRLQLPVASVIKIVLTRVRVKVLFPLCPGPDSGEVLRADRELLPACLVLPPER
jgi:hypothetical protein